MKKLSDIEFQLLPAYKQLQYAARLQLSMGKWIVRHTGMNRKQRRAQQARVRSQLRADARERFRSELSAEART